MTLKTAQRRLRLTDRAVKRGQGRLRGSSEYRHAVAIGTGMVVIAKPETIPMTAPPPHGMMSAVFAYLTPTVASIVNETVNGDYHLWFDEAGHAFLSFADDDDATLFRLALVGDLS